MMFFGERWDAPAFANAEEVPVPAGKTCPRCEELVLEGDSGILMPYITSTGYILEAEHLECHLRSVMGSVAHLEGRCSCARPGATDDADDVEFPAHGHEAENWREQGRQVITWLQGRR